MIKLSTLFYPLFVMGIFLFTSCEKDHMDDHDHDDHDHMDDKEYRYLRVLVSDSEATTLSLVNPWNGEISQFNAAHAQSRLYATGSKRYAAILHREDNLVETFDTGLEFHGDHVDVRGTPKFGVLSSSGLQPTHFKSSMGEIITFNDGDGTLSFGLESDVHTAGATMEQVDFGLGKHHGAMAAFSNGTYAVTIKTNAIEGALPEEVIIADRQGNKVHDATISTQGIHGNAGDGHVAVFGSVDGVLVVDMDGDQKLIPHPDDFGSAWLGGIYETNLPNKFIGYTGSKGLYMIDVEQNTITPIFESADILSFSMSFDLNKLGILEYSGELRIIDLATLSEDMKFQATSVVGKDDEGKPIFKLTERYAYLLYPAEGNLVQIALDSDHDKTTFDLGGKPYQMTLLGYETSESH